MTHDPKRIWLQPECCADPMSGRVWCQDPDPEDCDDGVPWTEYVRADLLAAATCRPDCLVCDRAAHLPPEARECLHRFAKDWTRDTFGGWGGFVVALLGSAWVDGQAVGRHEEKDRVGTAINR